MEIGLIIAILVAHWIGDFIMQTDRMAKEKSSSNVALFAHVLTYTVPLILVAFVFEINPEWVVFNGILHFGTDFVTSRINKRLWADGKVHAFFVSLGFDQLIHVSTLILTAAAWPI